VWNKGRPPIWEDHFYPEVIDPVTGTCCGRRKGELCHLAHQGGDACHSYRTRDLTRLLPGTARPLRRMEKVTAVPTTMMIIRGVNVFPYPDRKKSSSPSRSLSMHYQIVLSREAAWIKWKSR